MPYDDIVYDGIMWNVEIDKVLATPRYMYYLHFSMRYSDCVNWNNNIWIVYILFTHFQKIKNNKVTKYTFCR